MELFYLLIYLSISFHVYHVPGPVTNINLILNMDGI